MTSRLSVCWTRLATVFAALCALMLISVPASAQSVLEIVDIDTREAPSASIYFSARNADGSPIPGLTAEIIQLLIDGDEPPLSNKELRPFKDGERSVAVVVVFPIARDYIEEYFGIRSATSFFLSQFRQIDWIGYVAYGNTATPSNMSTGADIQGMAGGITELENNEDIEPNMFGALVPAIGMLKRVENVKQKYLVVVSNAEGAVVGDDKAATKYVQKFTATFKELGIRPLIVGYTPDGPEELTYRKWLKQLSLAGGTYTEAVEMAQLPGALAKVYDQIFLQYILDATVDHSDPDTFYLGEGKYDFTVVAKIGSQELKSTDKAPWAPPAPEETPWWVYLLWGLGILFGALLLVFFIRWLIKRKRNKVPDPVAPMAPMGGGVAEPTEFRCETCNKIIPEQLYNFRGEFCMSGGIADCPYYQMPDHGRLTVEKGPLGDVTFFIKEEITTVGKDPGSKVSLQDSSVSKRHAAIKVDESNRYELRDFGSTNGTYVNGDKIQRIFLKDGDKLMFGTVEVRFHLK